MNYIQLAPGDIIRTKGVKNIKLKMNDQQFTTNNEWLDSALPWDGERVPENVKFRRSIK